MRPQALIGLIAWTCLTMADASAEAVTFEVSFTNSWHADFVDVSYRHREHRDQRLRRRDQR